MRSRTVLLIVALLTMLALGFGLAVLTMTESQPSSFTQAHPVSDVAVSTREFDDAHTVDVALALGSSVELVAPLSGRVTGLACGPSAPFVSGQSSLAIDGQLVVNLATAVPLWRDLTVGMSGVDVQALRAELVRLGRPVAQDGAVDKELLIGFAQIFHDLGEARFPADSVPAARVMWLPSVEVTASECAVSVGSNIAADEPVASIVGGLVGASITHLPTDVVEGARVLQLDGVDIPVEDGEVTGAEGLAMIAGSPSFAQARLAGQSTVTGAYALAEPLEVSVVPPGALYGLDAGRGCVVGDGSPRAVTVVGSELGQSFVVFSDGSAAGRVTLSPQDPPSCG